MFRWGAFSDKALRSIRYSDARTNLWHGSVRSGKTISSIVRWLHYIENAPPGDLMVVGHTERTLKTNILDPIEQMVGPTRFKYARGTGEAVLLGRKVKVASAYNEASEGKIRGATLAGAYGDELTLWPENFFTQLLARLSVPGAKLFGTTNPDGPYHWLKANFLDRESELDLRQFHFTLDDNPNLPPEYVESLKAEYTGLWYRRFVLGEWVMAEGVIYDMFDPEAHVVDILPAAQLFERYIVGVDYGALNPTAYVLLGKAGDTWYVMREYYHDSRAEGRQKTDAEYSQEMLRFLSGIRPQSIEVDPSAASFIHQLRHDGLRMISEADNEVLEGIRTVGQGLANGRLKIHSGCTNLIREMATYSWDPAAAKRGEDKPIKKADHCLDAARYAAMKALRGPVMSAPSGIAQESYFRNFGF